MSSDITLVSASTGMKFVSPFQRGTTWKWIWSSTPAPLTRPMFAPKLYPCGMHDIVQRPDRALDGLHDLGKFLAGELLDIRRLPVRDNHEVTAVVRIAVHDDEAEFPAPHDQVAVVILRLEGRGEQARA